MTTLFSAGDFLNPKCLECGAAITPTAKFCPDCGAATSVACSYCGVAIPTTAKFCLACGTSQSPQQDAPVTSNSSKPFAQPNGTVAEPNGGRLSSPVDAKEEDRPIFAWANNSVQDDSEPEQSSGLLKLVLIGGALVLAIASVWGFSRYQREYAVAHFNRGEALKSNNDLIGARRELEACVSECPDGWEKEAAKRELEWIVPAIAAQGKPQPSAEGTERQEAVTGVPIDYPTFYAKSHTGLPVGKRYNFHAILTHDLCIQSDPHVTYDLLCSTRADFDKQEEYESLLRETGYGEGTIVASMGADGTINIHSFH